MHSVKTEHATTITPAVDVLADIRETLKPGTATRTARDEAFQSMDPELQATARKLDQLKTEGARSALRICWEQGDLVLSAIKHPVYGDGAVEKLASFLGVSDGHLYNLRDLRITFTRAEVDKLAQRAMADGGRITPGHLFVVMRIKHKGGREKMFDAIFNESLTVQETEARYSAEHTAGPRKRHGRNPKGPKSAGAGIEQITKVSNGFVKRVPLWTKAVFDELDDAEPDRFSVGMLEKMEESATSLRKLREGITVAEDRLARNITRAKKVLELRKQQEKTAHVSKGPDLPSAKCSRPDRVPGA